MKRAAVRRAPGFRVTIGNKHAQAAEMVLRPNASEGGPDNRHRGADQWLFVIAGTGSATVNRKKYPLRAGTLLLIEAGDLHEIRNTGRRVLRTLNIYVPPAYTDSGDELPRGKP